MSETPLVGLHIIIDNGEYYRIGKIVEKAGDAWLVEFEPHDGMKGPMELISIEEMLGEAADGIKRFQFFRTRAELDTWRTWLDTPSENKPKVVSLIKK
jgi:hypothetical protein